MKMTIPYNMTGKQRKQLAEDISVALHTIPKYQGYPTCAYKIGDCTLERDGKLIIPECVDDDTARELFSIFYMSNDCKSMLRLYNYIT